MQVQSLAQDLLGMCVPVGDVDPQQTGTLEQRLDLVRFTPFHTVFGDQAHVHGFTVPARARLRNPTQPAAGLAQPGIGR
jgi:hypothetical protein